MLEGVAQQLKGTLVVARPAEGKSIKAGIQ
jgi:hypothetical protein